MGYHAGPYARFTSLPSPDETVVTGSRKIDFVAQSYEIDDNGNAAGMDPIAQRVILAVSYAGGGPPRNLDDDRELTARKQRILAALESMVREGAITLPAVVRNGRRESAVFVGRTAAGVFRETVSYVNQRTQRESTVTVTHG